MNQIQQLCKQDLLAVNDTITQHLLSDISLVEDIVHYIFEAGGKRLRPILVLLVARALGDHSDKAIQLAAIIECLHTATLLHDDVIDMSDLRRGKPTANIHWSNASSVLAGDFIYARSFQMIVGLKNHTVTATLAQATSEICEGEVQQLMNMGNVDLDIEQYHQTITRKTATLFAAAAKSACVLAEQDEAMQNNFYEYGLNLGIAFQLIDDALDYQGDPSNTGKNIGDDLNEGKMTLPLMHSYAHANEEERAIITQAVSERSDKKITQIIDIVNKHNGVEKAFQEAVSFGEKARQCLSNLSESEHQQALNRLVDIAIERTH